MTTTLEQAITAEVRDQWPDGIVTGYILKAAVVTPAEDGVTYYATRLGPNLPKHAALGLASMLLDDVASMEVEDVEDEP
jgi:hypothetical protein